jgi:hypothetical protein
VICALIAAYFLYEASRMAILTGTDSGYYTAQMLITLSLFNVFFIIITGAFLGAKDFSWQTFTFRMINARRHVVWLSRVLLILAVAVGAVFVSLVVGLVFDFLGGVPDISLNNVFRDLGVVFILFFWGMVAFCMGFLTKSFATGSLFGIAFILGEPIMDRFLPEGVLNVLPFWNQKNLLKLFFPEENQGAVAIVSKTFGDPMTSWLVMALYMMIVVCLSLWVHQRRNY